MTTPVADVLYAPKAGMELSQWEDAAAFDATLGRFAVADGASSSYRANRWSAALTQAFIEARPAITGGPEPFAAWVEQVADHYQPDNEESSSGSWYASDASRRGSFATFVGLHVGAGQPRPYRGVVVGDSCFFHVRNGERIAASHDDAEAFDSTPHLLASAVYGDTLGAENSRFFSGRLQPGDILMLATDALGAAMLRLESSNPHVWDYFAAIGPDEFDDIVADLRIAGALENDDVTLMRVTPQGVSAR